MRLGRAQRIIVVVALVLLASEAFFAYWNLAPLNEYNLGNLRAIAGPWIVRVVAQTAMLMLGTVILGAAAFALTSRKP